MITIASNGIITVKRGDSFSTPLFINCGSRIAPTRYVLQAVDKLYLGVMEPNCEFEDAIIRQEYTISDANENGDIVIKFESEDTEFLLPGTYYYEVKVEIKRNGDTLINTVIPKTKFILM